jgi:hypothetical protein
MNLNNQSNYVEQILNRIELFDIDADIIKTHHNESRIFLAILLRAMSDVTLDSSPLVTRLSALWWLMFETRKYQVRIRDFGEKLLNIDHDYLLAILKNHLGEANFNALAEQAKNLPKKKREWA